MKIFIESKWYTHNTPSFNEIKYSIIKSYTNLYDNTGRTSESFSLL